MCLGFIEGDAMFVVSADGNRWLPPRQENHFADFQYFLISHLIFHKHGGKSFARQSDHYPASAADRIMRSCTPGLFIYLPKHKAKSPPTCTGCDGPLLVSNHIHLFMAMIKCTLPFCPLLLTETRFALRTVLFHP